MPQPHDARRIAPAVARNRDPILAILRRALPETGTILEIASGSGEHVVHFAAELPGLTWQPSDPSPEARASIAAWSAVAGLGNVLPPLAIDAAAADWPVARADAILAINMIHISPWASTLGLLDHAARLLPVGGLLYLYGPYLRAGHPLAPSNAAFDADLRGRNPQWGLRAVEDVVGAANGFALAEVAEMPANNLSLLLRRAAE